MTYPFDLWPDWMTLTPDQQQDRLDDAGAFRLVGHVVRWEVFDTLGQAETIRQVEALARKP